MLQVNPPIYRGAHRGKARFATLLVLTAMASGGVYAYRHFFHRGGEAATQLIPADALVVVTLDAVPSAGQVGVFKRIADACRAEHLDTTLEDMIGRAQGSSPLARDMRPFAVGSAAYALLKTGNNNAAGIGGMGIAPQGNNAWFVAVSDAGKVQDVLNRDAQKSAANGLDYYTVGGETRCMAVMGNYLVTADKPEDLTRIEAARRGETPAIATLADYQQARTALPPDSNMMLFVSAGALTPNQQNGQNGQGGNNTSSGSLLQGVRNPMQRTRYMAMGFAIHDRGIDSVMLMPAEPPTGADGQAISHIAPFDTNLFSKMPGGAYGILALSQPGKYYHYANALASVDSHFRQSLNEGVHSFERETGLNLTRDVLPGANGNVALAIYPDADNPQQNVDGLLVMDDANGADPAALADRIRSYVERESARHGRQAWRYTSENRNGVLIWTLNPEAQGEVQRSLGNGASQMGIRGQDSGGRGQGNAPFSADNPPIFGNTPDGGNPNSNGNNGPDNGRGNNSNSGGDNHDGANNNANGSNSNGGNSSDNSNAGGVDRRGDNGSLLNSGGSSRQSSDVDVHIHGSSDGRVYDDTFDLHHGADRVHADHNGVDVRTGEGDSLRINRNGLSLHSHDGDHVEINPHGVDIHAHDNGTGQNGNTSNGSQASNAPNGSAPNGTVQPTMRGNVTPPAQPDAGIQQAMRNKTVAYAQIGHVLLVASSLHTLDRAIAAYQNGSNTMATDPGYGQMRQQMTGGAQNAILINLPAILEAARPALTQTLGSANAGISADDILHLAGDAGNGLVFTQQYDGNTFKVTCFLPVDYEKAIHVMGGRWVGR